jgi:hypothetical protein
MVLKSTENIFPWKQKSCLKGTVARDFLLLIFFMNRPDSTIKNMPNIAEVKLSSYGLQKKLRLRNCGIVDLRLRNCNCGSASQVAELLFRTLEAGFAMWS